MTNSKITSLVAAMDARFQSIANKVTSWSSTPSDDKYPSEKLVKDELDNKISKSNTVGLVTNNGTIDTNTYLTSASVSGKEDVSNKITSWSTGTPSTEKYPAESLVKNALDNKISTSNTVGLVKNDGTIDTSTYLTAHQSLSDVGGIVSVEKQTTAETGYAATYVIKQGSSSSKSQVGVKINIPKDLLLQSASVETVGSTPTTLETSHSLSTGDSYIKFIANTVDNDNAQTPLVIPIDDLFDLQSADESTITLSNSGVYSIKAGGITSNEIATSLSNTWLTTGDVDSEIEDYIDALTTALSS